MSLRQREKFNIIKLEKVDSTNLYAKSNLTELADRDVICADMQTCGRGRFERAWIDLGSSNIFMSVVLKPSNDFKSVYANLTQYFSVVLCEILEEYGVEPQIKWPNDVLVDGKKIAGILSESVMQGQNFKGFILGAGINLNAKSEDLKQITDKEVTALNLEVKFPLSVQSDTFSHYLGEGNKIDKTLFLDKLINKFFENYDNFLQNGFNMIKNDYIKRTCFLGKEISVKGFNNTISGLAKSINSAGELVLEKDGNDVTVTIGDILWNN